MITCPLCGIDVDTSGNNPDLIINKHIDRCSRRNEPLTSVSKFLSIT